MLRISIVLIFVSFIDTIYAVKPDYVEYDLDKVEEYFQQFIIDFDKTFKSDEEYKKRLEIFRDNLDLINSFNKEDDTAVYGINQFSDLTFEEVNQCCKGLKVKELNGKAIRYVPTESAPDAFDWRSKNVVTPVKDQGGCGSCYIFSTIGAVEGQYAIKHKTLVNLSEQQALDCDKIDRGCDGGEMGNVAQALVQQGGSEASSDYPPYNAEVNECRTDKSKITAKVIGAKQLKFDNEEDIKNALYSHGPLAIALDFSTTLRHYKGGVAEGSDCNPDPNVIDHALVLVGYGIENGVPYWLIKNSWGEIYGDKGYLRLKMGNNTCNIRSLIYQVEVL